MFISDLYSIYLQHPTVTTDSRLITPGCIFFGLKGENFDGNAFAKPAIEAGAAYAIVDDREISDGDRIIYVDDVLLTLQELAVHHRKKLDIPVIAITGTNGKTTTKELVNAVLSEQYITSATKGNLNNHIGVPLTILSIGKETEIAIIETGANHKGEIAMLCKIAMPTHGLITNIGKAHLEGFGGYEGVIEAKTEMYTYLRENNGTAFINSDDQLLIRYSEGITKVTYGTMGHAKVIGEHAVADPMLRLDVLLPEYIHVNSNLFGMYNVPNLLAACCIGRHFNVEPEKIRLALESYYPVNNRSQVRKSEKNRLFLDAYNANPSSMELAIRNFASLPSENRIYILGDMLELGDESYAEHEKILELLQETGAEQVFLIGPVFMDVNRNIRWMNFQDSELAAMWFSHHIIKGADILIKGSRGIRMEKIVEYL